MDNVEFKREEAGYHSKTADVFGESHFLETERVRYYHRQFLMPLLSLPKGSTILEVGCGIGRDAMALMKEGYYVAESDISLGIIRKARENQEKLNLPIQAFYVLADAENLPFESSTFDAVFIVASLHHLPDPIKCLKEMARCVKLNGLVVIGFEPNRWWHYTLANMRVQKKIKSLITGKKISEMVSVGDLATLGFSYKQIVQLLTDADLNIISMKPVWYLNGFMNLAHSLLETLFPNRTISLPLVIEKIAIAIDGLLGQLPIINRFGWHWNIITTRVS